MQPLLCTYASRGYARRLTSGYQEWPINAEVQTSLCATKSDTYPMSVKLLRRMGARRCEKLGIAGKLKADDKDLVGKPLMKRIMQAWLPAHEVRRQSASRVWV